MMTESKCEDRQGRETIERTRNRRQTTFFRMDFEVAENKILTDGTDCTRTLQKERWSFISNTFYFVIFFSIHWENYAHDRIHDDRNRDVCRRIVSRIRTDYKFNVTKIYYILYRISLLLLLSSEELSVYYIIRTLAIIWYRFVPPRAFVCFKFV